MSQETLLLQEHAIAEDKTALYCEMGDQQVNTSDKTLFVRGLSYNTTDTQLEDAFSDYGPIKTFFTVKSKGELF